MNPPLDAVVLRTVEEVLVLKTPVLSDPCLMTPVLNTPVLKAETEVERDVDSFVVELT